MRYLLGFILVLALGVMGCGETAGTGGSGGDAGTGGTAGTGGGGTGGNGVACQDDVCPCTEAGIRAAIAEGGGPFTFDCDGPTTVVTEAGIVIGNDVILDGEGNLTVVGNDDRRVFQVVRGVTAEFHSFTVTRGQSEGGGDGVLNYGTLRLTNSTVSGHAGDGIHNLGGTLTLTNSTVSGNAGYGIYTLDGMLTLTNCTVAGTPPAAPAPPLAAAIRIAARSSLSITNSIVVGGCETDILSGVASLSFNIESPGDTCRFGVHDQVNVTQDQLNLGPLQDNGGPTETHALLTEPVVSVAVGTGHCDLDIDQRGVSRPQGNGCDVGAFEREPESDACWPSGTGCFSPKMIEPIVEMCEVSVPDQANACVGTESFVNPATCTPSGNKVAYKLTHMQVVRDCNTGHDLDGCKGTSCDSVLSGPDSVTGIDNGLLYLHGVCLSEPCTPSDIGTLDQALHNAICEGGIDIEIEVDPGTRQGCAVVTVTAGGESGDPIPMNLSGEGCLSGTLGVVPVQLGDSQGAIENAVVRMTLSPAGFSDGILAGTAEGATAAAIAEAISPDVSIFFELFFDINADLSGDVQTDCDALSMTLEIGGDAIP